MPKADALDQAGQLLVKAAQDLKAAADSYGPEQGRRATSDQAVYGILVDVMGHISKAADALVKVGTQLRTAAAELENADEA
jgi:hypothetical protein